MCVCVCVRESGRLCQCEPRVERISGVYVNER